MTDKTGPAEYGAPVEIDNWITERIEKADGAICPCDSCLEFYEELAQRAIQWCRENEGKEAFDDYLKAKETGK